MSEVLAALGPWLAASIETQGELKRFQDDLSRAVAAATRTNPQDKAAIIGNLKTLTNAAHGIVVWSEAIAEAEFDRRRARMQHDSRRSGRSVDDFISSAEDVLHAAGHVTELTRELSQARKRFQSELTRFMDAHG